MSRFRAVRHRIHQWVTRGSLLLALDISSLAGPARLTNAQGTSPNGIWSDITQSRITGQGMPQIIPLKYSSVTLNV